MSQSCSSQNLPFPEHILRPNRSKAIKLRNSTLDSIPVPDPKFSAAIANVTVPVGREGVLTCLVQDLGSYKVAWLRVDTQTILTIQNHVITKNNRIGIGYTEKRIWQLRIKDVKETDRGWYMCQINSDPMKSQVGHLEVVGESSRN